MNTMLSSTAQRTGCLSPGRPGRPSSWGKLSRSFPVMAAFGHSGHAAQTYLVIYIYMCVCIYIYIIQYYSKSGCSKGKVSGCAILVQAIRGTSTSKGHASPWFSIFWSRRANALWEQSLRLKSDACDITDRCVYILYNIIYIYIYSYISLSLSLSVRVIHAMYVICQCVCVCLVSVHILCTAAATAKVSSLMYV